MLKALIALALACVLTAPMIAQADAEPGLFFQYEADQHQPMLVAHTVAVDATKRTQGQLEAVAVLAIKTGETIGPIEAADYRPGYAKVTNSRTPPVNGPLEIGWRS